MANLNRLKVVLAEQQKTGKWLISDEVGEKSRVFTAQTIF